MSLIQKYIWVIETIYRACQISLRELSEKYISSKKQRNYPIECVPLWYEYMKKIKILWRRKKFQDLCDKHEKDRQKWKETDREKDMLINDLTEDTFGEKY